MSMRADYTRYYRQLRACIHYHPAFYVNANWPALQAAERSFDASLTLPLDAVQYTRRDWRRRWRQVDFYPSMNSRVQLARQRERIVQQIIQTYQTRYTEPSL